MWGEKNQKRYVLSARLKTSTVEELRIDRGRLFQSSEPKRLKIGPRRFYGLAEF